MYRIYLNTGEGADLEVFVKLVTVFVALRDSA